MILGMQIPEGSPLAGMAHHSAHDVAWTALATRPDQDTQKRYLYPATTAATLNLAASAAQASRVWTKYNEAFSTKCIAAAEKAWKAALANPAIYASTGSVGGGDYGDNNVTDEFYWAGCELYITTGKSEYLDYIKKSPFYLHMATAKANIQKAADDFISIENSQGYGSSINEGKLKVSTPLAWITGFMDQEVNSSGTNTNIGTSSTSDSAIINGDINKDGRINVIDCFMLKNYILGKVLTEEQLLQADVNGDAKVNVVDCVLIRNYIVGKITKFE